MTEDAEIPEEDWEKFDKEANTQQKKGVVEPHEDAWKKLHENRMKNIKAGVSGDQPYGDWELPSDDQDEGTQPLSDKDKW